MNTCKVESCSGTSQWPLPLCQRHWYQVPHGLRQQLWAAQRNGVDSAEYAQATQQAIDGMQPAKAELELF